MLNKNSIPLETGARQAVQRLREAGFSALWAGGCVRDLIMERPPKDYDIATNALPEQVVCLFPGSMTVGKAFGVVRARVSGHEYEIATFRKDLAYRDGRHPDGVEFADEPTDARRRDFTVNALFLDPLTGVVHDHIGGQADIAKKMIRAVGNPRARFAEDYLRMMRAARFAATLQFEIDPETFAAIAANAGHILTISIERVQQELTRTLLEAPHPGAAIELLSALGLLKFILPEVEMLRGQEQPPQFHPEGDVWTHTIMMLNSMRRADLHLAYAALLHDIGKPGTARLKDGRLRFDCHAGVGAQMAGSILKRLRLPNDDIKAVCDCVANHMRFMDVQRMRPATLRRLVGAPTFATELELHRIDCAASHGDMGNYDFLVKFQEELRNQPVLPKPWINGHDLMKLGITDGPEIGRWKQLVYEAQLEGVLTDRDAALAWLRAQMPKAP